MKELLLYMAKSLVDHPEAVSVTQTQSEDCLLYTSDAADEL